MSQATGGKQIWTDTLNMRIWKYKREKLECLFRDKSNKLLFSIKGGFEWLPQYFWLRRDEFYLMKLPIAHDFSGR